MKIIIEVEGGCVTGVYSSEPVLYEVRDKDAEEIGADRRVVGVAECFEAMEEAYEAEN